MLINTSFESGQFPSQMKVANVIPIPKKDDKTILNNYRPISLLPNISKIVEKLMHKRLYQFLDALLISITEKFVKLLIRGNLLVVSLSI